MSDDDIDVAVVKKISKGGPARSNEIGQPTARGGGDFFKLGAIYVAEKLRALRVRGAPILLVDRRINMAVRAGELTTRAQWAVVSGFGGFGRRGGAWDAGVLGTRNPECRPHCCYRPRLY